MQRPEPPEVKRGDEITVAVWEQMRRAIRACRLIEGPGIRLQQLANGTLISAYGAAAPVSFQWQPSLQGVSGVTLRPGTVNSIPATIRVQGQPVPLDGGKAAVPPPVLLWKGGAPAVDGDGRGYVAAEVSFDAKNKYAVAAVEVVQLAWWDSLDGSPKAPRPDGASSYLAGDKARHPLAMLRLRSSGALDVYQCTHFPLTARVAFKPDGLTPARVFFS